MRSETSEAKTAKVRSEVRAPGRKTVGTVFVMVVANAATQFAIQAWMSYRFAKDVWAIPRPLCIAIIVALDLFAVTFMVFTYLMRNARWFSQAYVWAIFAAGVGAQLFAAELYGSHEHWKTPVRIFAALPALFLASSLHGLIIWRNHAGESTPESTPALVTTSARTVPAADGPNPAITPPPASRPTRTVKATPRRTPARKGGDQREEFARRVVEQGERPADLAAEAGRSKRAIELWVKDYREKHSSPQVNGHEFHADGPAEAQVN